MANDPKTLGQAGEEAAASFLKSSGFHLLHKNWRSRIGEIDIIAKDGSNLCFIEVKTRDSIKKGLPRESVTRAKQKKIIRAAQAYCQEKNLESPCMRFDVVEVFKKKDALSVNLIKNAFWAE